jgi:hypothetical protein
MLAGTDPDLDIRISENHTKMKKVVEERTPYRMAKVHDFLAMQQGSQNLRATKKESPAQHKQRTALEYIMDTNQMSNTSWSLFEYNGAAAFKLSEGSPLPPHVSVNDLPGRQIEILNVHRIQRIILHQVESNEDSTPGCISDTEHWLTRNRDLDTPRDSDEDCAADVESDIEQEYGIEDPE